MTKRLKIICASVCIILIIVLLSVFLVKPYVEKLIAEREYYYNDEMRKLPQAGVSIGEILSLVYNDTLHVRFIEMKRHEDEYKRAEYVFEIVEWLTDVDEMHYNHNFGELKTISVYSWAYPYKLKSYAELYAINYGHTYEVGKEYVIVARFSGYTDDGYADWVLSPHYFPLEDISRMNYKEKFNAEGITDDMTSEQVVAKIKLIIFEYLNDD